MVNDLSETPPEVKDATDEMLDEFEELCEKYANEDINPERLLAGIKEIIDNYSG